MTKIKSDFKKCRYVAEGSYGAGADGAAMQDARFSEETLKQVPHFEESKEITGDQQIADENLTNYHVEGDISSELYYGSFDDFFQYLFRSSGWSANSVVLNDGTASAVNATNKYTHGTGWDNTPSANQWIYVSGFSTTGNNGWSKVSSADGTNITVTHRTLTDEAGKSNVTMTQPPQIVGPGTTDTSFSWEREYSDVGSNFVEFKGCKIASCQLTVNADAVIEASFNVMGKSETSNSATAGDGSPTAANTNRAFKTDADLEFLHENATSAEGTGIDITIDNSIEPRYDVGTSGPETMKFGNLRVTGTYSAIYESSTLYDKVVAETSSSLAVAITDPSGNRYLLEIPTVKFLDADRTGGGLDSDVELTADFKGLKDSSESITCRMVRFPTS